MWKFKIGGNGGVDPYVYDLAGTLVLTITEGWRNQAYATYLKEVAVSGGDYKLRLEWHESGEAPG